ncbi:helix-turn-helix transcriptional regulator [Vibrio gangliei]|uniref:helix-turn-helix transcriptional regulator n=1 Tax=Vibrio gangliei TaxID=2077090 RepID=UPI000D01545F|nr:helix-turn-helix transcriptional regulator [Vibrio gangliei]
MQDLTHRLGQFIRAHREQLPAPNCSAGKRRTPGLRREELAQAAGISTTLVTWLEQGRHQTASPVTLARLAQALQLNKAERGTLFELAEKRDPYINDVLESEVPATISALVEQFSGPCYILDARWNAKCWNSPAEQLFLGWLDSKDSEHNLLRYTFLSAKAKQLITNWSSRAQRLIAEFRVDFNRIANDGKAQQLIEELCEQSPLFKECWHQQNVSYRDGGKRYFTHPTLGECCFEQTTLLIASAPQIKLVCLTLIT